jgi:hypothetical protein
MSDDDNDASAGIETWTSAAFSLAGVCFVLFAGLWGAFAIEAMESRVVQDAVGPVGWTFAFVGLLGIARELPAAWLRRLGGVFASLGLLGGSVTALGNLLELGGVVDAIPGFVEPLQGLLLAGIVLGFLVVAVGVARTAGWTGRLALLLATPPVLFLVNVGRVAALGSTTPTWAPLALGAGQAIALLAIGYVLRTEGVGDAPVEQAASRTAR